MKKAAGFPDLLLTRLDGAQEVDIETLQQGPDGKSHTVTIWVVVHEGAVYVRSVRGKKGRWYRELVARKTGVLRVGTRKVAVRPVAVTSPELIDQVSAALWRKYPRSPSLFSMTRLVVLDTTLRLDPAEDEG